MPGEPLIGREGIAAGGRGRVDVGLEGLGAAGDDEADGLNVGVVDGFEGAHNFVLVDRDSAFGEEGEATLGVGGLVLGKEDEALVGVFVVADVAVTVFRQNHFP